MKTSDVPELDVLEAIETWREEYKLTGIGNTPDVSLSTKFPVKLIMSRMAKLQNKGLIDVGVSLRTAWLTDKGKEYLTKLRNT